MYKLTRALLPIFAAFQLVACGGGGGGSTPSTPPTSPSPDEFIKTYAPTGPKSYDADIVTNISTNPPDEQSLYLAGDALANSSGYITGIRYTLDADVPTAVTCPYTRIWMRHTNLTDLGNIFNDNLFADNGQGNNVEVFNGAFTVPAQTAGSTFEIKFDTPFLYNGVDNLFMQVERSSDCTGEVHLKRRLSTSYKSNFLLGTSTPVYALDYTQFVFSAGEDAVTYPVTAGATYGAPFTNDPNYQHVQILHHASDIAGKGKITGVALRLGSAGATTQLSYHVTVKMGYTTKASLTDTFANNFDSGTPVTVSDNALFVVPANEPAGQDIWLPIQNSFDYNGKDNLVIDITATPTDNPAAIVSVPWAVSDIGSYSQLLSNAVGYTYGNLDFKVPLTILRFQGAPTQVMAVKSMDDSVDVAYNTNNLATSIRYPMSAIGSVGTINGIACRLDNTTSVAGDYPMMISLQQSDGGSPAIITTSIVFNDTVTIPNTVGQGDWIEIPFTTPFTYYGKSDLTVMFGSGVGAAILQCDAGLDANLYPSYTTYNVNNTGNFVANKMASMKFNFQ